MSVFHNNALIGAGAGTGEVAAAEYVIPKSLRFNSGDTAYLSKTFSTAGNRRTWSVSFWFKKVKNYSAGSFYRIFGQENATHLYFYGDNIHFDVSNSGTTIGRRWTSQVFRDNAAWMHCVAVCDTTASTASERMRLYINGSEVTSFSTTLNPSQNALTSMSSANQHTIGYRTSTQGTAGGALDALIADFQFVDGQALAPTAFGETRSSDGVWVPKEYTGNYNAPEPSFGLSSSDIVSSTGFQSGEGADKVIDSTDPTANRAHTVAGNAGETITVTFDPAVTVSSSLEIYAYLTVAGDSEERRARVNSGDWFNPTTTADTYHDLGFTGSLSTIQIQYNGSTNSRSMTMRGIRIDGAFVHTGGTAGVNGFHLNFSDSSTNEALGFDSAPTTPDPDPKKGFDVITYDGTYARLNVGGLNFEPGLVWIKNRDSGSSAHFLADIVRGGTKVLQSNSTGAENTRSNHILSFNPDGFTLGADGTSNYPSGNSFVAWVWRAGGPAVSKTSGTIDAEVSANTDYGFSICKFTGTGTAGTIEHGLSTAPKWYMVKNLDTSPSEWNVFHVSTGETKRLKLNSNSAAQTAANSWNDTAPTASLFTVGTDTDVNKSGDEHIAYLWSEVSGFSKFGVYAGSGASGKQVTGLGFKPRYLIVKAHDASASWVIVDSERGGDKLLFAEASNADSSGDTILFLDDGFQIQGGGGDQNYSGRNYVYMAFADRPGNNWDVNNIVTNEGLTTSKTQFDVVTYTGNGGTNIIGGVVYSAGATATGGFEASNPAANGFNGTLTAGDRANGVTVGGTIEIVFSPGLSVSSTVGIWSGKSGFKYQINDSGSYTSVTNATEQWHDASFSGTLTNLKIQHTASNEAPGFSGIRVDGSTLIDGDGGPGLKFQPDFVWIKSRSSGTEGHYLANSVSGLTKNMRSNATSAEQTNTNGVTAADANGFTLGDSGRVNGSSQNYVAWCWKAGGTAVSNTDGSITSSVSANAQYGFSIVSYTGTGSNATVGHGLNTAPKLVIARTRDRASNWAVYHGSVANMATGYLYLNSTIAFATDASDIWNSIDPTSSVFSIGTAGAVNTSSDDHIAYCFADVPGYQRIGSYTGNGSSTGPVVVTGFKPRFLLIKAAVGYSSGSWIIVDSERSTTNPTDHALFPNSSNIENNLPSFGDRDIAIDFLSNGFQIKNSLDADNKSSVDYIYLAIGDDEIGSDEDCLVDVPNAVTADADATDTTGGYQRGNYSTWNPLFKAIGLSSNGTLTLTNGNLEAAAGGGSWTPAAGTIAATSGKWYAEFEVGSLGGSNHVHVGISPPYSNFSGVTYHSTSQSGHFYGTDGQIWSTGSPTTGYTTSTTGDIIGVALDFTASTVTFYKNGVSIDSVSLNSNITSNGAVFAADLYPTGTVKANFGQMRFKYPMPSGYAALNTTALPAATIADGSANFEATTYAGNDGTQTISGINHSPDLVWIKVRNETNSHYWFDTLRGPDQALFSDLNSAETDYSAASPAGRMTAFTSDGFTVKYSNSSGTNANNDNYIAWTWNAGANSNKTYTVKVVSDNGNKYRFDDFGTSAVTLDLAEGSTYVFDQSDSSNSGHPLRFSTTSDGTHNSGTEYTTGVTTTGTPGSAGAKTTIVVGSGVATLYYYCTNHSGMGGQANTNSTAGASNFDGSIQSTVKANPEVGFSIVTYTGNQTEGATVGHGLNSQPLFITVKDRSTTKDWYTLVKKASGTGASSFGVGYLSDTNPLDGLDTNLFRTNSFDNTPPTSSVFQLGSDGGGWSNTLNDTNNYVAYCFTPVAGYSAIGFYTGNGSSDGPFVYTGFRPAIIVQKRTDSTGSWTLVDTARDIDNPAALELLPNSSAAEYDNTSLFDILSNGFKVRATFNNLNASSGSFIYIAFAENPFQANGGLAR